jgi:hypothetical protein
VEDYQLNSGSKTRNRFISPNEYDKVDALSPTAATTKLNVASTFPLGQPTQSQSFPLRQPSQSQSQAQEEPTGLPQSSIINIADSDDDSKEDEESECEQEIGNNDKDVDISVWTNILQNTDESDSDSDEDIYSGPNDDAIMEHLLHTVEEDPCEVAQQPLPPLPLMNDPKYPQEDIHYFKNKNYVRKDKYKLSEIVELLEENGEYNLPTIVDGYGKTMSPW